MDEGLKPAIYEIVFGWDAGKPVLTAYGIADTLDEALKGAKDFCDMYPWPAEKPDILSVRLLYNADYIIVSKKYMPQDSARA